MNVPAASQLAWPIAASFWWWRSDGRVGSDMLGDEVDFPFIRCCSSFSQRLSTCDDNGKGGNLVSTPAIHDIRIKRREPPGSTGVYHDMKRECVVQGLTKSMIDHLLSAYDAVTLGDNATWLRLWPAWRVS